MSTGVYQIKNLVTGRLYVGATTTSFCERFSRHKENLNRNVHNNIELQEDWIKYSSNNFEFSILEEVFGYFYIKCKEEHWIRKMDKIHNLYNMTYLSLGIPRKSRSAYGQKESSFFVLDHLLSQSNSVIGQIKKNKRLKGRLTNFL